MFKLPHIEKPSIRIKVIKYFITMFCSMYFFQGMVTVGVCIWFATQRIYACDLIGSYSAANYLLLTAALMTMLLAIVGMYKTIRRNNEHFFRPFMFILIAILATEFMSAILAHVHQSILSIKLLTDMTKTFSSFYTDHLAEKCVTSIQEEVKCCGVKNFTEMVNNDSENTQIFPESCLCDDVANCVLYEGLRSSVSVYNTPCYTKVLNRMKSYLTVFRIIGPVLAGVQLIFLFVTMYFVTRVQKNSIISAYVVQKNGRGQNTEASESVSQVSVAKTEEDSMSCVEESEHI